MPKFKSSADHSVVVSVPGHSVVTFEPGESVDADDPAVIAAFEANPDVSEVKQSKQSGKSSRR